MTAPLKTGIIWTRLYNQTKQSFSQINKFLVELYYQKNKNFYPVNNNIQKGVCQAKNAILNYEFQNSQLNQQKNSLAFLLKPTPFCLKLNYKFMRGKKYIIGGQTQSGKSSLFNAFLGNMNLIQGQIFVNGSISYIPQIPFFSQQSVQSNILFGQQNNEIWYDKVIQSVLLKKDIQKWKQKDMKKMDNTISTGTKKKIAIARAIYSKADIYFLDNCLNGLDLQTKKIVYQNAICHLLKNKTVIMVINDYTILQKQDLILQFKKGQLKNQILYKDSKQYQEFSLSSNTKNQKIKNNYNYQKLQKNKEIQYQLFKKLLQNPNSINRLQLYNNIAMKNTDQIKGVQIEFYLKLQSQGNPILIYILITLYCILQATRVFLDYFIGAIKSFQTLTLKIRIILYGILNLIYLLIFILIIFLSPYITWKKLESFFNKITKKVCSAKLNWFINKNPAQIIQKVFKDSDIIYLLNINNQEIIIASVFYLATTIIVSYSNIFFIIPSVIVVFLNYLVLHFFLKAQRQFSFAGQSFIQQFNSLVYQIIYGIDVIRPSQRIQQYQKQIYKRLYKITVAKINHRYLYHAMNIMTQISALVLITITLIFATVSKIQLNQTLLPILGTSIVFSLKLAGSITNIMLCAAKVQILMKQIKGLYELIQNLPYQNILMEDAPKTWPQQGNIIFQNVCLSYSKYLPLVIDNLSFQIEGGNLCLIYGQNASGKTSILQGINRILEVINNSKGRIMIDNINISQISRKCKQDLLELAKNIIFLTQEPFIFNGTIKQNIDPFHHYNNQEIIEAMKKVGLYQQIGSNNFLNFFNQEAAKLNFKIQQNIGQGFKQLLNLVRALLIHPKIIIIDNAFSQINTNRSQNIKYIIKNQFKQNTVVMVSHDYSYCSIADYIMLIQKGKLVEEGTPYDLVGRNKYFYNMLKRYNVQQYNQLLFAIKNKYNQKKIYIQ